MPDRPMIICNACVLAGGGRVWPRGFVSIRDGAIESVGDDSRRPAVKGAQIIDADGRYVLPGFINPHMHLYGALALGVPAARMRSFKGVLERLWWRLDRALTLEDVHVSATLGAIASLKAGVTTIFDHHASYGAIRGSLHTISKAVRSVGLRASLCYEISDRAGKRARDLAAAESTSWLESVRARIARDPDYPHRGMVGLHASMSLSDSTLAAARELMDLYGVGAHVHVAEGIEDVRISRRKFGATPAARFAKAGILRRGSIAAHCVHVGAADIARIARSEATVAHNPMSNLANAVGIAPALEMARRGIPVAVGTDGMSAGISEDVRLASVLHRPGAKDAQAGSLDAVRAVWDAAPALAKLSFGRAIGVIKKGACADVIVVDSVPATPVKRANAAAHLIFGAMQSRVRTAVVGGRVRMRDFVIPGVDEGLIAEEARRLAARLWRRFD